MVENDDEVRVSRDVCVELRCVHVSKGVSPYHHPYICAEYISLGFANAFFFSASAPSLNTGGQNSEQ